ncbi:MAG: ribosome silencing factor [Chrysiogenales bacterium]|nr:MAG: ribosome silencing factor [Chrysiogenales bacterium]
MKEAKVRTGSAEADNAAISMECARSLDEKKAEGIVLLDLRRVNSYFDYFLIATGNSRVHCRSLARELQRVMIGKGVRSHNRPDYDSGWIVIDFGGLIVHIFTSETRDYYQLEKLWGDGDRLSY